MLNGILVSVRPGVAEFKVPMKRAAQKRKGVRSLIGGLDKERSQRTTQVFKLAPDTPLLTPDTFIDSKAK